MNIYSIKDIKADRFQGLVCFPNDSMAKRAFASAVNSPDVHGLLSEYPEDCQIFRLGTFNDKIGELIYDPHFLWNGTDLKKSEEV